MFRFGFKTCHFAQGCTTVCLVKMRDTNLRSDLHGFLSLDTYLYKQESPIFQLQVTFAAMQMSKEIAFNPVKLVESLKLRTTEQQDAQECVPSL